MKVTLTRILATPHGVIGILNVGGFEFFTLEEEWKDNEPSESCIPAGTYPLRPSYWYGGSMPSYEIAEVPNRSRILVHPGNTEEDTRGCVLLGLKLGFLSVTDPEDGDIKGKKLAVLMSRAAFSRFMATMAGRGGTIEITWGQGNPEHA